MSRTCGGGHASRTVKRARTTGRIPLTFLRSIPTQIVGLALGFWGYHELLVYWMRERGIDLGAVTPDRHVAPLYAEFHTRVGLRILPALAVMVGFLLLSHRWISRNGPPVLTAMLFFVLIGISVAQIDGYPELEGERRAAFLVPYSRTKLEHFGAVPRVDEIGLRTFVRDYAKPEIFETLPAHARTHPPGCTVFLWVVSKIFGSGLLAASLASILFTSLAIPAVALLAEERYGKAVSRYALVLFLLTPNVVLFTTTSMDGPSMVFPVWSVYLFCRAARSRCRGEPAILLSSLAGLALAFGMFMTYATVCIGFFIAGAGLLALGFDRTRFVPILQVAGVAAVAFAGFYVLMFAGVGFNLFDALWASVAHDASTMGTGHESLAQYLQLSSAGLLAFLIGVGIPLTAVWVREVVASIREARSGGSLDLYVLAFPPTLLAIAFSTLFTMEVERIWIFLAPFLVIAAAKHLHARGRPADFWWVAGLLGTQILVFEVFLEMYW